MREDLGDGVGPVAVQEAAAVERSLDSFLSALSSPVPGSTAAVGTPVLQRTLSWVAVNLGEEGVLPEATVTWPGHKPTALAADAVPTTNTASAPRAAVAPGGAEHLEHLPIGAGLVDSLARIEVADLDDADLVDVAARWQDVVSWVTALQSRALGEVARRRSWTAEHNGAAAEISARLRVPQGEANKHMARGAGLAEHPTVMNALHDATIDTAKADILLRSGNPLTLEEREEAISLYLPQAPDRTRRWLREKMNAFATRLKGSTQTVKHAMTRRAVFLDPVDNHMAWISANLPATDAAAVWDAIDQAAHVLRRTPGGTRTLAQARADALVAIMTGRIIVPPHPECAPATGSPNSSVTAGGNPGDSSDTTGARDDVLPRTTVPASGCTCGGCGCGGTSVRVIPVKPQIRVTVPATMLLGLDNTPGHLEGYGPIPADLAARIASDATWQRLVTDPVTGILTDYSTTTYQPGKVLRQAVIARDQTCTFPQCERPARWADLDHIHPFDHHHDPHSAPPGTPGQTRAQNLHSLCRAHHLAKTHHGWAPVLNPATGVTVWTAPTGHTYDRPPTRTGHVSNDITSLADDTRHRLGQHVPGQHVPGQHVPGQHVPEPPTPSRGIDPSATALPSGSPAGDPRRAFSDEPPF